LQSTKKSAIIVAGGLGTRMNSGIPKQFLLLGEKPMLMYSMEAFTKAYPAITVILALPAGHYVAWQRLCDEYAFMHPHHLVAGGQTRFHSVQNALQAIDGDGLVAIHDGARPLVSVSLIQATFLAAEEWGNCIPVTPVRESLRLISGNANQSVNRQDYRAVQTPQVFHAATIKKAYGQEFREDFTDDAMVAESIGETIHMIDGDATNLKVTHPCDLAAAEALLSAQEK
jgi:2-C-methyl-D-erythritol 4-phosphate cytidylyltransferase